MQALAPVNETAREMREMIYLWRRPLRLLDGELWRFLGQGPASLLNEALRTALEGPARA